MDRVSGNAVHLVFITVELMLPLRVAGLGGGAAALTLIPISGTL
jgi:hypothetical protein